MSLKIVIKKSTQPVYDVRHPIFGNSALASNAPSINPSTPSISLHELITNTSSTAQSKVADCLNSLARMNVRDAKLALINCLLVVRSTLFKLQLVVESAAMSKEALSIIVIIPLCYSIGLG